MPYRQLPPLYGSRPTQARRTAVALLAALALAGCGAIGLGSPPPAAPSAGGGTPQLALSKTRGARGQTIPVTATLRSGGRAIAGTQNDIGFDARQAGIAARPNGRPDCRANPAIGKDATAFSFLPKGCRPPACTQVRALVLSLNNVDPIPNGSVLYTCQVTIPASAVPGSQGLAVTRVGFSSPSGEAIAGGVVNGSVHIE